MKKNFIKILLVISLALFLLFCFVFISLYGIINKNNQKAESNAMAWQTEMNRRNDIALLNNSLEQISNDRAELDSHFAQSSDVVPFLNTIEQLAGSAGLQAVVDGVDTGVNNNHLVVELKVSGSFASVYKFLNLLENSSYETSIVSADLHKNTLLSVPSKGTPDTDWEAIFKIQLLSFIP